MKMKKGLIISIIFLVIFFGVNTIVYANAGWDVTDFDGLIGAGQTNGVIDTTKNTMGTIINVIRIVGTGIAVIMLTYVAIKYMSAAPSEKADFKKSATGFIVGAVVLFATTQILGIIANFAQTNIK